MTSNKKKKKLTPKISSFLVIFISFLISNPYKMVISNITLVRIASVAGVATLTMGLLFKSKIEANVKATEYYKEALKQLRNHKAAVHLLGEPIKDRTIDIGDEKINYTKQNFAKYEVPVRGPKQKGILYFWAERENSESSWVVKRIELELGNDKNERLVVKSPNTK